MNQNEPIFLNLYIRDTESYRKITKIVGNKQIMRVKKLISFYEIGSSQILVHLCI